MKKWLIAASIITVYVAFPAYRYYLLGSLLAYRVVNNKNVKYRIVSKHSKHYQRIVGVRL